MRVLTLVIRFALSMSLFVGEVRVFLNIFSFSLKHAQGRPVESSGRVFMCVRPVPRAATYCYSCNSCNSLSVMRPHHEEDSVATVLTLYHLHAEAL